MSLSQMAVVRQNVLHVLAACPDVTISTLTQKCGLAVRELKPILHRLKKLGWVTSYKLAGYNVWRVVK